MTETRDDSVEMPFRDAIRAGVDIFKDGDLVKFVRIGRIEAERMALRQGKKLPDDLPEGDIILFGDQKAFHKEILGSNIGIRLEHPDVVRSIKCKDAGYLVKRPDGCKVFATSGELGLGEGGDFASMAKEERYALHEQTAQVLERIFEDTGKAQSFSALHDKF